MPHTSASEPGWSQDLVQQILTAIQQVRYGSVEIIIHDSKVVQIERKEKIRFDKTTTENKKRGVDISINERAAN
ncbi:MAG TPA: YezD family protein [Methylomirabilota bacterium]|jgi:hypothetical protein|nr:YezD family protein [Methylomirabilota bacterium]